MSTFSLFNRFTQRIAYINEILLFSKNQNITLLQIAYKALCIAYFLRCLLISTAIRHQWTVYLNTDLLWKYLNQDNIFDCNAVISISMIFLTIGYFTHIITVKPHPFTWQLAYETVVINSECFFIFNKDLVSQIQIPILKQIIEIRKLYQAQGLCRLRFSSPQLDYFPNLSNQTRVELQLLVLTINLTSGIANIFMFSIMIGTFTYHSIQILFIEGWIQFAFCIFDYVILAWIILIGSECVLIFGFFHAVLAFLYWRCSQIWRFKLGVLVKRSSKNCNIFNQILLGLSFDQFRKEQIQLMSYLLAIAQNVTNRALFIAFCTTSIFNIYLVSTLLIRQDDLSAISFALVLAVLICHFLWAFFVLSLLILTSNSLVIQQKFLVKLQCMLGSRLVLTKIRIAVLYERLQSEKKIGFTIGPIAEVNRRAIFQFCFIYTGFIFFAMNLIKRM